MRPSTERDYRQRILKVLVAIQERLDAAISLEDLAAVASFSPYHFHRVFRGMVGESVMEHVRRLRLERAAFRLKFTDQPVTNIAFDAGYETHEAFTRAFRARFDESPSGFREKHRTVAFPVAPSGVYYSADADVEGFTPVEYGGEPLEVRVERVPPTRVIFVRHVGPYKECGTAWCTLYQWAFPKGLCLPTSKVIGLAHDDPEVTAPAQLRYDACITVGQNVEPGGNVGVQEIAGGEFAITRHHGSYEGLPQTYFRLCGEWLPASGREVRSAPAFEVYINNPQVTPPDKLLTDVYLPLASH